ncbi:response regulator [Nocardioides sp.]|uniref:response regulator transcription factor n=1 Tax=Nocardioides sp. TaxID=35761 RepID=UPI00286C127D|nr:response regulator [Nocardioides sp.]
MVGNEWTAVIIEDDPDVRDLIEIVLTQSGFHTVVAEDGVAGVEAVRTHNPLITTLDVNMPGMDGFAVAKRLRDFSSTYLIFITSLGDEIDVVQGFEAGADDYLVKPFRPRELRARADSMLRRPRARQDTPAGPSQAAAPPAPEPVAPVQPPAESWAAKAARELKAGLSPAPFVQPVQAPQPVQQPAPPVAPQQPASVVPQAPQPPTPVYEAPPAPVYQPAAPAYEPSAPAPQQSVSPPPAQPVTPGVAHGGAVAPGEGGWLRFNGLALNAETRVVSVGGGSVDLTRAEFDLLASLLGTGRRVRSKADLVLTMRGQQYVTSYFVNEADKRAVETNITSLRRKLGDDGAVPRFIETVRGVGYRIAEA